MEQESLDCPNCGASVSSDKTACEFCGTPLKTVACPSCFGLMFLGSKFCSRCGAKAVSATVTEEENRNCPRCKIHLGLVKIGETTLHECEKCGGLGYKGRVAVVEVILMDHAIENAIRTTSSEREIWKAAKPQGIRRMSQDGAVKILQGVTSIEELNRVVDLADETMLEGINSGS